MNARIIIGSAPDSWGVWFADDPEQTTADRFLTEVGDEHPIPLSEGTGQHIFTVFIERAEHGIGSLVHIPEHLCAVGFGSGDTA